MPIPIAVQMDWGTPTPGGLLAQSRSLPPGWERGISFTDTSCLTPVAMGECPSNTVVVTPGVNEVQSFTITPGDVTGGTFTLTFPEGTTAPIPYNADGGTLLGAINAVLGFGRASTQGFLPGAVQITYTGSLGSRDRPLLTGDGSALTGPTAPYTIQTATVTPGAAPILGPSNLKPTQRPGEALTFRPVELIQSVTCTTMGGYDVAGSAGSELDRTRDYALASELLTAAVSTRDAGPTSDPNPSLVDTATDLGEKASLGQALACLEQALGKANSGRGGVVFVGYDMVTHLKDEGLVWRDGTRWRTAAGSTIIASPAFDGRAPLSTDAPASGDPLYMYATTTVWAGVGTRFAISDVNRSTNDVNSRAEDPALVAFPTCAVFAVASTTTTAC